MEKTHHILRRIVCLPIKFYQYLLSPVLHSSCRYHPSCSRYAETAIKEYGVSKGIWLGLKRIMRCHPWAGSGYDPVVPNDENL